MVFESDLQMVVSVEPDISRFQAFIQLLDHTMHLNWRWKLFENGEHNNFDADVVAWINPDSHAP